MNAEPIVPNPENREARLRAAHQRIEFWDICYREYDNPQACSYFLSRKHHWVHVAFGIERESHPIS